MQNLIKSIEYYDWVKNIKSHIKTSQIKAALSVNRILTEFYFDLGRQIFEKQKQTDWGDKLISQLSTDLKNEFPEIKGFSSTNLKYCRKYYEFYKDLIGQQGVDQNFKNQIGQQPVDLFDISKTFLIPWSHNILIFTKTSNMNEAGFYISQTIENNWGRETLALQIKTDLYNRQGKSINNFKNTLPANDSDLANQTLKDPYTFDFFTLAKPFNERDIENQLVSHISKFLLELGKGFAFVGKQYHIEVAENDYYLDLLFYHIKLKCYVVVELKNTKFIPEYAGKMNFYLSAVDTILKKEDDKPTIGILLCRDKNNIEAEFALRDISKPMGVSEFVFTEIIPENLKSSLPTIEEIENELK
jgi:predicted nuclease of restriction endonuclease-like (RecB) superfamily